MENSVQALLTQTQSKVEDQAGSNKNRFIGWTLGSVLIFGTFIIRSTHWYVPITLGIVFVAFEMLLYAAFLNKKTVAMSMLNKEAADLKKSIVTYAKKLGLDSQADEWVVRDMRQYAKRLMDIEEAMMEIERG